MIVRCTVGTRLLSTLLAAIGFLCLFSPSYAGSLNITPAIIGFTQVAQGKTEVQFACYVGVPVPRGYQPFVHLVDGTLTANEGIVANIDPGMPSDASSWAVGATVTGSVVTVTLPATLRDGSYEVEFGIFSPTAGDRLLLNGNNDGRSRFLLGQLIITDGGKRITMPGVPHVRSGLDAHYHVIVSAGHFVQTASRTFTIIFGWAVHDKIPSGEQIFVHIVNPLLGQQSDPVWQPGSGIATDPSTWPVGLKTLSDPVAVTLPGTLQDGRYDIRVGLFKTPGDGSRLDLAGNHDDGSHRYTVGTLLVSGQDSTINFVQP